jgi:thiol-disulfide isomerase/thioredoxin
MSAMNICTEACHEAAKYSIFVLDLGWFGILFFSALLLTFIFRSRLPLGERIFSLLVFSAAGAEAHFIWLQKYVIGHWCPLCLGIAAAVYCAVFMLLIVEISALRADGVIMKPLIRQLLVLIATFTVGLGMAVIGVHKEAESAVIDPFLGKTDSSVTVYFISDWFCPGCRKIEPEIERMYPEVAKLARVTFIDYPIHPESANFTPYNAQFLVYEKKKYPKLRHALSELALKTKTPSPEEVQSAIAPIGVKLHQINYADILYLSQLNLTTYRGYGVKLTPTVVVANTGNNKFKLLEGANKINSQTVINAIMEMRIDKK